MKDFKLDTQPKIKSVFEANDTYLNQLEMQVVSSIQKEKSKKTASKIGVYKLWRYAAAAVIVFALAVPIVKNSLVSSGPTATEIENELLQNTDFGSLAFALDREISLPSQENETTDPIENELLENTNIEFLITEQ